MGFIKKVMKQLQQQVYLSMKKVDVELKQLEESESNLTSPGGLRNSIIPSYLVLFTSIYSHFHTLFFGNSQPKMMIVLSRAAITEM